MNSRKDKTIWLYLAIMFVLVVLSRLYWIFGDDPIGLILIFFFLAPVISFLFGVMLGNEKRDWVFPFLAGCANVANYICNSMMTVKLKPDSGTLWVFSVAFAAAWAGVLFRKLGRLFTEK
jgi:surface polysaccharide O-acyltransferase-like enzyme